VLDGVVTQVLKVKLDAISSTKLTIRTRWASSLKSVHYGVSCLNRYPLGYMLCFGA
jgi:hypothetical protein